MDSSLAEAGCFPVLCPVYLQSNKISEVCTIWEVSLNLNVLCVAEINTSTFSFLFKALLLSFRLFRGVFLIEYLFLKYIWPYGVSTASQKGRGIR